MPLMCFYFYRTQFQPVDTLFAEQQQTPTFKVKSVNLDNTLEKTSTDQIESRGEARSGQNRCAVAG